MFQFYVNKTLILSERHCWVLELNEVVISLSGKGGGSGKVFYGYVGFFFTEK